MFLFDIIPPNGILSSIREWAASVDEPISQGVVFNEIYPATSFSRKIKRPPTRYPYELEAGDIGLIPHGRVWGLNGAIITPDNNLIWDVSLEMVHPRSNHSIFQGKKLPLVSQYYKRVADLTHVFGRNYYHWMYEVLPRVHLLQKSGLEVNQFVVKSEPDYLPFQTETLHQLGITTDQLIKTHSGFHIQAEELIVPSQPSFATKWGYDFLRDTFLKEAGAKSSDKKRIYISRKWSRRITNEEQLMEVLRLFGFIKVELETLSVREQVQLFSSVEVIIAAHGAGLTNLTFCQPGTKIVEIFSPTYITSLYWVISSLGDLKHYYFIGQFGGRNPDTDHGWVGLDNLTINLPKFTAFLKSMRL